MFIEKVFVTIVQTCVGPMPFIGTLSSVINDAINGTCKREYSNKTLSYDYGSYAVIIWQVEGPDEAFEIYHELHSMW